MWPSQVVVVLVYGGSWAGGVGLWAVVVVVGTVLGSVVAVVVVVGVVLGVVMVVMVGVVVVVVVVVESVVVVVLRARPQDPLAFRWDVWIWHRLQPLGPHGLVDSRGRFGAGLDGDCAGGVPRPRVGLAGADGGLWGVDCWAFGDGDVAEGLGGVVLCGRRRGRRFVLGAEGLAMRFGRGSCWRRRFWRCRPFCGYWGCVWWCWWCWSCWWSCGGRCCCWRWCSGCGLGSGWGLGTGSRWKSTSFWRCGGRGVGRGCCCRGAGIARVVVGGASGRRVCGCGVGFGHGLVDEGGGEGQGGEGRGGGGQ